MIIRSPHLSNDMVCAVPAYTSLSLHFVTDQWNRAKQILNKTCTYENILESCGEADIPTAHLDQECSGGDVTTSDTEISSFIVNEYLSCIACITLNNSRYYKYRSSLTTISISADMTFFKLVWMSGKRAVRNEGNASHQYIPVVNELISYSQSNIMNTAQHTKTTIITVQNSIEKKITVKYK